MATTRIYANCGEFRKRADRETNGIGMETLMGRYRGDMEAALADGATNEGCWDCTGCRGCTDCEDLSDCRNSHGCTHGAGLRGCSDCHGCDGCTNCEGLSDESDLHGICAGHDGEEDGGDGDEDE